MATVFDYVSDVDVLVALSPEELAFHLLQVARASAQRGMFHRDNLIARQESGRPLPYDRNREGEIKTAVLEALHWLECSSLIMPAEGVNGNNGFRLLTRQGNCLLDKHAYSEYQQAAAFPKAMLHPVFADRVWLALARGEFDTAVFIAFRAVEEAVREAGGYKDTDIGVSLMRKAFKPENGPLTDTKQPEGEQEALMHLFAGAIGSYKNPHSHRSVTISDSKETQEMVLLASHLMGIVDSRRAT